MFDKGGIYLANLNPNKSKEPGKIRPVLVLQSDTLNKINHPTIVIVPLSTRIIKNTFPLRFDIKKRAKLTQNSTILCDQIRTIDTQRLVNNKLAQLLDGEMLELQQQISWILDFNKD